MKNIFYSSLFFISSAASALHYRSGEITYFNTSGFTYQFTLRLIVDSAGQDTIKLFFGSGDSAMVPISFVGTPPAILGSASVNYTYPGSGQYTIYTLIPNHVPGIVNVPASGSNAMYLEDYIDINPVLGNGNNSASLFMTSYDTATAFQPYQYNSGGFDMDGDSLDYTLTIVNGQSGYPAATTSFRIDSITGIVYWTNPFVVGPTNFAIIITEYRSFNNLMFAVAYMTREVEVIINPGPSAIIQLPAMNALSVFPNPSKGDISILMNTGTIFDGLSLEVYDIAGNKVEVSYTIHDNTIVISRPEYSGALLPGLYFFRITGKTGPLGSGKFEIIE